MLRTSFEGEHFLHRMLWRVVLRQIEHATKNPQGAFHDHLVAMVFAFHTFEAYLNFAGERLAPEIWANERDYFRKEPHRGFDGKVRTIIGLVGIAEPDRTSRPYSSVWLLKELRDLIAHAKPEKFSETIDHPENEEPSFRRSQVEALVTHDNAFQTSRDIEDFIEMLHQAPIPRVHDIWFGDKALKGVIGHSGSHTSIAP